MVLAVALLLLASICVGLLIAVVSDSERQAVQLSLLVLLASVFFSGFVLPITEFSEPVRAIAYTLPGDARHPAPAGPDAARDHEPCAGSSWRSASSPLVTLVLAWVLLRRGMTRA